MFGTYAFGQVGYGQPAAQAFTLPPALGVIFAVDNVRVDRIRVNSVSIRDVIGAQPNTGSLIFDTDFPPTQGASIKIGLGSFNPPALLFAGQVQNIEVAYESVPAITIYPADLIDHTFRLNKRRPFGAWTQTSATTIAKAIVSSYAPAFSTTHVEANLPPVSINFDGTNSTLECLAQLATAIDGQTKVDYLSDVHLFVTPETEFVPAPIDAAHPPLNDPPITFATDLSQCRTRVFGKGHGEMIGTDLLANETLIPIPDVSFFLVGGAQAIVGTTPDSAQTQIVTYTSTFTGTGGTLVGPGITPAVGPTLALSAGAGLGIGTYQYAITFVTASGETKGSPATAITTVAAYAAPTTPIGIVDVQGGSGSGIEAGQCRYAYTFVVNGAETLIGPASTWATTGPIAPPPAVGSVAEDLTKVSPYTTYWRAGDVVQVYVTWRSGTAETIVGPSVAIQMTQASGNPAGFTHYMDVRNIPLPTDSLVTAKRLYFWNTRTNAWVGYREVNIAVNDLLGIYQVDGFDQPPGSTTISRYQVIIDGVPVGPPGTTERRVYRWGPTYQTWLRRWTVTHNNPIGQQGDVTPSSLLAGGPNPPTTSTPATQVAIAGVALGPTGTTNRKIYRTAVNGAQLKYLKTITGNTVTDGGIDAAADATLGADVPTGDTSGLQPTSGQINAGASSIITAGTAIFQSPAGWVQSGQQLIRYSGISGNTLTGIPATGPGAITATIPYGQDLSPVSTLAGVSGLAQAVSRGASVHVWVQRDDLQAQYELGLLERDPFGNATDGIREYLISDERRGYDSLRQMCDADLARFARPIISATYATRDLHSRAGQTVHIHLTTDEGGWGLSGDFLIQDVAITIDHVVPVPLPRFLVHATSARFTFRDLLQRVLIETG